MKLRTTLALMAAAGLTALTAQAQQATATVTTTGTQTQVQQSAPVTTDTQVHQTTTTTTTTSTAVQPEEQSTTDWEGSAYVRYATRYVFRGDKKSGQAMQANIQFNPPPEKNGFYVGGWANQPFASERKLEFDLYGGYEYNWEGFEFDGGATGYFYPQASGQKTSYTYELNLSASHEILRNWFATITLYYDFRLQAFTPEFSTGYRIPYVLGRLPATLDLSAFIGNEYEYNAYPDANVHKVHDGYVYYGFTVSTTVWFTRWFNGAVGIQYGDTINKAYTPVAYGGYGRNTADNLYGYVSLGVRW